MNLKENEIKLLNSKLLEEISSAKKPPCISLYQSTHRQHPENLQDPIRYRGLLKNLKVSLLGKYSSEEIGIFLKPFEELVSDEDFWSHTLDGLAVFGCPGYFRAVKLPRLATELVIVADSFHTKPLRRLLQTVDRYQVLGVSLDQIQLFEGNRYELNEIEMVKEVPRTFNEALGPGHTDPYSLIAPYGGFASESEPIKNVSNEKIPNLKNDNERFFRAVDEAILEYYSKPSALPLILAALPEHQNLFQSISINPNLISEMINFDPHSIPITKLQKLAWQTIEPQYNTKIAALNDEFMQACSHKTGSDDLEQVAQAVAAGRVKTLLIEGDRQIGGRIEATTGKIALDELSNLQVDDVLDDLGEQVKKMNGQVFVVPAEQMPSRTGLAAIYRF